MKQSKPVFTAISKINEEISILNDVRMTLKPAVIVSVLFLSLTVTVIIFSSDNLYGQLHLTAE